MASLIGWRSSTVPMPSSPIRDGVNQPVFMQSQPLLFRRITSLWQIAGTCAVEPPLTLRFQVQEEGVDTPFYTRGVAPFNPTAARRRSRALYWADGVPGPIFDTAASANMPFPLNVAATWDPTTWRLRRLKHLLALLADPGSSLLPPEDATSYSSNLCDLLSEIQRHLLEPTIDGGLTWQLWTRSEVLSVVQRRLARFMQETGIIRERREITLTAGESVYHLPSDTLQVRRVGWTDGARHVVLEPTDRWELANALPGWEDDTSATPQLFELMAPLRIRIYPTPNADTTLQLVIIPNPATPSGCQALPIPTIFVWAVKWGIISDLLRKEGEANDPERAKYAEGRYEEGVELARLLLGTEV